MSTPDSITALETRPIPGFPGYYAREDGVILSGIDAYGRPYSELRELKQQITKRGYLIVCLSYRRPRIHWKWGDGFKSRKQKRPWRSVHRLILKSFVGEPKHSRIQARHLDGNPKNNSISNLAWGTIQENRGDSIKAGTIARGKRIVHAKLDVESVKTIRRRRASGETLTSIACDYGVRHSTISQIALRQSWAWVSD